MNKYIKEILDDLDYCKNRKCGNILLKYNECDELLYYITNLQENEEILHKIKEYCKNSSLTLKSHYFSDILELLEERKCK